MPNLVNKMLVRELSRELEDSSSMLIVSMSGVSVAQDEKLRTALAEKGVRLRMVRNTLARVALQETGHTVPEGVLEGTIAMAWGSPEHTLHAAKIVDGSPLSKEGKLAFRGGMLDGAFLGADDARALASIPDRDTLRAMLLGVLSAPARGLVSVLNALPASVARVLQARADEAADGAASEEPATEG